MQGPPWGKAHAPNTSIRKKEKEERIQKRWRVLDHQEQIGVFVYIKCNIYQHSVTVNDFSSALKNVLSQIKNAKK